MDKFRNEFISWTLAPVSLIISKDHNFERMTKEQYGSKYRFISNFDKHNRKLIQKILKQLNGRRHKYMIKTKAFDCHGQLLSTNMFAVVALKQFSIRRFWWVYDRLTTERKSS
jgi:hypothetical protein